MSHQPLQKPTGNFAVYSHPIAGIPNSRDKPAVYDLFLQPLHGGRPLSLTLNRKVSGLGRSVTDVTVDSSGKYVAFRSDNPKKPKALPPRLTTQFDHLHSNVVWVCTLQSKSIQLVAIKSAVESYAWSLSGSILAIEASGVIPGPNGINAGFAPANRKPVPYIYLYYADTRRSRSWLQEPGLGSWAWWKNDEAIVYHSQISSKIILRSIKSHRVLKHWVLPEKSAFYRLVPSPNGKSLLITTDSSIYLAREPDWKWHKILQELSNVPDSTILWLSDSEHLVIDHVGYVNRDFGQSNPPEAYHEVKIAKPYARYSSEPAVAKWADDTAGSMRTSLVGVSKPEKYALILRGGSNDLNSTDTLEFYDLNGRKLSFLIKGFVDSIDVKTSGETIY